MTRRTVESSLPAARTAAEAHENALRLIFGKLNDLVRFVHKNQGVLFSQAHRRPNLAECKEQEKRNKALEKRRKRAHCEEHPHVGTVAKAAKVM